MKNVSATACGKFILLGEHFATQGSGAISFPLQDLKCTVRINPAPSSNASFASSCKANQSDPGEIKRLMLEALQVAKRIAGLETNLELFSEIDFPISRGYGSSAAFSVSLAKAVCQDDTSEDAALKTAHEIEKIFHKNPSGIDVSTIFYRKPLYFRQGRPPVFLANTVADFVVVDSGERMQCTKVQDKVSDITQENPSDWLRNLHESDELASRSSLVFQNSSVDGIKTLADCMTRAHEILSEIELSSFRIDQIIELAKSRGALAGKVSGAGGGGAVVLLAKPGQGGDLAGQLAAAGITVISVRRAGP